MTNEETLEQIHHKLIVSCQALEDEPLHSSYIMSRMAYAAYIGGAAGIRANTAEDITEIQKTVDLPVIGIIKKVYADYPDVYITPSMAEVDILVKTGCQIIAMDATDRIRHDGMTREEFFRQVREKYPDQLFMADCASYEDGMKAAEMGFDLIGTTMAGYTDYTKDAQGVPYEMIGKLVKDCDRKVIAEGHISTPQQLKEVMKLGVWSAVVGSAITRPQLITRTFTKVLDRNDS